LLNACWAHTQVASSRGRMWRHTASPLFACMHQQRERGRERGKGGGEREREREREKERERERKNGGREGRREREGAHMHAHASTSVLSCAYELVRALSPDSCCATLALFPNAGR
jgi:hypothetical protein